MSKKTFTAPSVNNAPRWFEYRQSKSGGHYQTDDDVSINVLVQATSAKQANQRAVAEAGIYFDGVDSGQDCSCCGDRWHEAWFDDGLKVFRLYDWRKDTETVFDTVEDYAEALNKQQDYVGKGDSTVILYYLDGTKTVYYKD